LSVTSDWAPTPENLDIFLENVARDCGGSTAARAQDLLITALGVVMTLARTQVWSLDPSAKNPVAIALQAGILFAVLAVLAPTPLPYAKTGVKEDFTPDLTLLWHFAAAANVAVSATY
jgi:hypothetical protein